MVVLFQAKELAVNRAARPTLFVGYDLRSHLIRYSVVLPTPGEDGHHVGLAVHPLDAHQVPGVKVLGGNGVGQKGGVNDGSADLDAGPARAYVLDNGGLSHTVLPMTSQYAHTLVFICT